ncbi:hypothetical protein [Lysinibacillus sp. KU-BSD001]|uniref:hypothetical protein n=1 Tax=Lysinibacillus sp. KU-BSD001 TaxID=3141328 RepID=UPI0036F325B5
MGPIISFAYVTMIIMLKSIEHRETINRLSFFRQMGLAWLYLLSLYVAVGLIMGPGKYMAHLIHIEFFSWIFKVVWVMISVGVALLLIQLLLPYLLKVEEQRKT